MTTKRLRDERDEETMVSVISSATSDKIGTIQRTVAWYASPSEEGSEHSTRAAETLMLLSDPPSRTSKPVFECKTCNRSFPSFQALGGHRTAHNKPRVRRAGGGAVPVKRRRVHECSVCGLEFEVGQALGGHMRRHRNNGSDKVEPSDGRVDRSDLCLELSLSPPDDGMGFLNLRLALGF